MLKRAIPVVVLGLALGVGSGRAPAQGCSQCRESVGQTPARTQHAYRQAIAVLILAATGVCGASVVMIRRFL